MSARKGQIGATSKRGAYLSANGASNTTCTSRKDTTPMPMSTTRNAPPPASGGLRKLILLSMCDPEYVLRSKHKWQLLESMDILRDMVELIQSVAYLHTRGIMHRSLSRATFVRHNGRIKVALSSSAIMHGGWVYAKNIHHARYVAPELDIARGATASYNQTVDLWALGMTLLELLCGTDYARSGADALTQIYKICEWKPYPIYRAALRIKEYSRRRCVRNIVRECCQEYELMRTVGIVNIIADLLHPLPTSRPSAMECLQQLLAPAPRCDPIVQPVHNMATLLARDLWLIVTNSESREQAHACSEGATNHTTSADACSFMPAAVGPQLLVQSHFMCSVLAHVMMSDTMPKALGDPSHSDRLQGRDTSYVVQKISASVDCSFVVNNSYK